MASHLPRVQYITQLVCAVLAFYLCLLGAAWHKRVVSLDALNARIIREATTSAERGPADYDRYLYAYPSIPWQSGAIYLFEHGRCDPRVERILLLLEARRSYDSQYIYGYVLNSDLRHWLIPRCLGQYPSDPLVAWAAGRLELTLGDYPAAAKHLGLAQRQGFDPVRAGVPPEHFQGRLLTALILGGQPGQAEQLLRERWAASPEDDTALADLLDFLCQCDRQEEALALWRQADRSPATGRLLSILLRAYWWSGRLQEYRALAQPTASAAGQELYDFDPRLALLDGNLTAFNTRLPVGTGQRWRAEAEVYAVTRRPALINDLEQTALALSAQPQESLDWDAQDQLQRKIRLSVAHTLRARILAGEWEPAARFAKQVDAEHALGYSPNPTLASNLILLQVYHGQLDDSVSWWLGGLGDDLPKLLLSRPFAEAVRQAGRTRGEVLAQIAALSQPYQGNYYDYGNDLFDLAQPAPAS